MENILKEITVIINGHAGSGHDDAMADDLRAKFRAHGMDATVILAKGGKEIIASAEAAVARRATMVAGGGGDGTQNAVAGVLAGTGIPYGVLPMGTLNHFAKDLGIPLDLDGAVRTIATGVPRQVDVGAVNDQVFLNNSSLGLYPDIVRDREKQQRRLGRGKWLAAALGHAGRAAPLSLSCPMRHARWMAIPAWRAARRSSSSATIRIHRCRAWRSASASRLDDGTAEPATWPSAPTRLGLLRFAFRALMRGKLKEDSRDFDIVQAEPRWTNRNPPSPPPARGDFDGEVDRDAVRRCATGCGRAHCTVVVPVRD